MKIIANEAGKASQKLNPDEVLPSGGFHVPELIRLISERYGFANRPTIETSQQGGAKFTDGRLIAGSVKKNIRQLTVFNDGLEVLAGDTSSAELMLDDLLNWAQHAVGLRPPITYERFFENVIVAEFEASMDGPFKILSGVSHLFQSMLTNHYKKPAGVALARIAISNDAIQNPLPIPSASFIVERRDGIAFSANRYFSLAPLRTDAHVQLLEEFERTLLQAAK